MIELFPSREAVLEVFGLTIYWYGLLYVVAFWVGLWLLPRLALYRNMALSKEDALFITVCVAVGVIVGGRLGYVFLYNPMYFWQHSIEIFALHNGGMSSHGGFIGVALALWYVIKKLKLTLWQLADVLVVPVALGLALGRIGNFINQELYIGSWALGVAAVDAGISFLCWYVLRKNRTAGSVTALFFVTYSIIRFLGEYVRIQEWPSVAGLTLGQLYTIPLFLFGVYLLVRKFPLRF